MEKTQQPFVYLLQPDSFLKLNFQTYHFNETSAVFIPKGEYVSIEPALSLAVDDRASSEYRFLFSQVLSVGHVDAGNDLPLEDQKSTLKSAQERWLQMNPFNATQDELSTLFDLNEWLEQNVEAKMDSPYLSYHDVQRISKEKLDLTFFQWKNQKLINKARKSLFETKGSVKEASYLLGFKDPAYFSRFFKNHTSLTPGEFVDGLENVSRGRALFNAFSEAMNRHITNSHQVTFYANLLSQTPKTFTRNIHQSTGLTPKEHITKRVISLAKEMLFNKESISSIAFRLGFEEVGHFSTFFKLHTGVSPSNYSLESTSE
ncbi:helix-turn-helix domain-containing protein [Ekhidna sp.]|uniref:helix-turn-helix domain-containing protein n=1 Tax=Ekhidna sp. TaxID=2608089 RepID=UPI003B513538